MCNSNNIPKTLSKNDFYKAFYNCEIKCSEANAPLRSIVYGEALGIAAQAAFELYQQSLGILPPTLDNKICLTDRQDEFQAALGRGFDEDFEVYDGWDTGEFFVINQTKKNEFAMASSEVTYEYKVEIITIDEKLYGECECRDFIWRKRLCKHLSQVLLGKMFGRVNSRKAVSL
jgi:hypothetical protein